jgi:hypothetical protein
MNVSYLPEHVPAVMHSLDLAIKERSYLEYSASTLAQHALDGNFIALTQQQPALAEKVGAFVSRFGRLQDHVGEKLLPQFAMLLGEKPSASMLNLAEKRGWVPDVMQFIQARKLRNLLVHEYMHDEALFLEALTDALNATAMLYKIVSHIEKIATDLGLHPVLADRAALNPQQTKATVAQLQQWIREDRER